MSEARARLAAQALALVGLTDPDPAYRALVAPAEMAAGDEAAAAQVAKVSDCILVRMAIEELVFAGLSRDRYRFGSAGDLITARDHDATRVLAPQKLPCTGDGLHWAPAPGFPEHFETQVAEAVGSSVGTARRYAVQVVAGGERNGQRLETVAKLTRVLVWSGGGWVDLLTGRRLANVIDADLMAARYPLLPSAPGDDAAPAA